MYCRGVLAPRNTMPLCAFALTAALAGCGYDAVTGRAFGTTYAIQAACPNGLPQQRLAEELQRVDRQMSTFNAASELSAFNRAAVGTTVAVSPGLAAVAAAAQRVAAETGGAFDATVSPLVALWGFGAHAAKRPPTDAELREALGRIGYQRLEYNLEPPALRKIAPLTLDFSGIAKGYAVDRLAAVLEANSCRAYLIELGGEIRAFGTAPGGRPWRIGIDSPEGGQLPQTLVAHGAVATSGDYRQGRADGATHIVDPRSGRPVAHRLAAVTVVADQALYADAYATALIVLGEDAGMDFAERHGLAALFVVRTAAGLDIRPTRAMRPALAHESGHLTGRGDGPELSWNDRP